MSSLFSPRDLECEFEGQASIQGFLGDKCWSGLWEEREESMETVLFLRLDLVPAADTGISAQSRDAAGLSGLQELRQEHQRS